MNTVYRLVRRSRRPHERQPEAVQSSIAAHLSENPYSFRPEPMALGLAMLR
ncbi:hypothetical protein [Georgenia subflava]|uniref:hypothetical protein n=1 Tax=Georgenia subflava TaxID=1622177 RepID=UPI00186B0D2A|nr:hypothetical protein [Georgenia subflava]